MSFTHRVLTVMAGVYAGALSGCGVYLHDDGLQKQTTAAVASYKAANVSGAIKASIAAQAALDQQMLDSIVAQDATLRAHELASLLAAGNRAKLDAAIVVRLKDLGGTDFVFVSDQWKDGLAARELARIPFENQARLVELLARRYRQVGGAEFKSCDQSFALQNDATAAIGLAHRQLADSCTVLTTFEATATAASQSLQSRVCSTRDGSLLKTSCDEVSLTDASIKADKAAADAVEEALNTALKRVEDATRSKSLDERTTQAFQDFSKDLAKADELAGFLGSGDFKPSAALAAIEFRRTNICDVLAASANASCSGDKAPTEAATEMNQAIVGIIAGLAKISDNTPPGTDLLSIALAHQTGLQKTAQASLEGWTSRRALIESKQTALVREVEYLLQARAALASAERDLATRACAAEGFGALMKTKDCKAGTFVAQALTAYSLAWAEGRTVARVEEARITEQITMTNLRIALMNAEARDAALTTALTKLDAFGQGGVSAEVIAEFLQAIGVAAIANGVN